MKTKKRVGIVKKIKPPPPPTHILYIIISLQSNEDCYIRRKAKKNIKIIYVKFPFTCRRVSSKSRNTVFIPDSKVLLVHTVSGVCI